jgi:acetyl esterase/lipase
MRTSHVYNFLLVIMMMNISYSPDLEAQLLVEGAQDLTGIAVYRNLDYVDSEEYADDKDKLDIFMPQDARNVPVVVFFHGGALKGGTKVDGEALVARIVRNGIGVVSPNYRLTPTVQHPGHVNDAAAAFAWVKQNIQQYGVDPERIYLSGHSAGAYLAVLLALDPTHLQKHGMDTGSIKGVAPISPFLYVEETAKVRPKDVWGEDPSDWLAASVTPHINRGKPPMLMIYADGDEDWRREQNERFVTQMKQAGNQSISSVQVSNRDHLSIITRMNDTDDEIQKAVLRFIEEYR